MCFIAQTNGIDVAQMLIAQEGRKRSCCFERNAEISELFPGEPSIASKAE